MRCPKCHEDYGWELLHSRDGLPDLCAVCAGVEPKPFGPKLGEPCYDCATSCGPYIRMRQELLSATHTGKALCSRLDVIGAELERSRVYNVKVTLSAIGLGLFALAGWGLYLGGKL